MRRILFPTDFSIDADSALKYAVDLCKILKAELFIFHSSHINAFAYQLMSDETHEDVILKNIEQKLNEYCDLHSVHTDKIKIKKVVEYGLAVDAIVKTAKRLDVQLIIMGTKGASGIEKILIGSNTMSVIEKAHCPVFAVPSKSKFNGINKIVYATDYRENDIESIIYLSRIADLFKSTITIVHVSEILVPANYENALLNVFEEDVRKKVFYKNITFQTLKGVDPVKALNKFIAENNIDLIALSKRRRNIFSKLFNVSFTKKVAYHTSIPLLAFHTD